MNDGDDYASLVTRAMLYQISSEMAALATTLCGKVDALVLTGEYAAHQPFSRLIGERVSWISRTLLSYHGDDELRMMARSAFRVLHGVEALNVCE
jgi:butyrate kinase